MSIKSDAVTVAVVALVLVGAAWYIKKKVGDVAAGVGDSISQAWDGAATYATGAVTAYGDYIDTTTAVRDGIASSVGPVSASSDDAALYDKFSGATDFFALPSTNQTECERAMAEGRTWDASFACDASTFLRYLSK